MGNYQRGLYVGADAPVLTVTALAARAIAAEAGLDSPNSVVTVQRDGTVATFGFSTRALANEMYDDIANSPGNVVYVAVFDRTAKAGGESQPYDSAYFVAQSQAHAHTRSQSAAGWVAAAAASLFGLMAFGKKRRGS